MEKEPVDKSITIDDIKKLLESLKRDVLGSEVEIVQRRVPNIYQQPECQHNSISRPDYDSTPLKYYK